MSPCHNKHTASVTNIMQEKSGSHDSCLYNKRSTAYQKIRSYYVGNRLASTGEQHHTHTQHFWAGGRRGTGHTLSHTSAATDYIQPALLPAYTTLANYKYS